MLQKKNYTIEYFKNDNKFLIKGNFWVDTVNEYYAIKEYIFDNAKVNENGLVIDLTNVSLINSMGIIALSLLLIKMKNFDQKIKILGSKDIDWQLSLKDLENIRDDLSVEFVSYN